MRIQAPDLVQRIVRRYGIVGAQGPDTIAPEIVPVSIVDELLSEQGEVLKRASGGGTRSGVAGEYSLCGVWNPSGGGVIVLPRAVYLDDTTGPSVYALGYIAAAPGTAVESRYWDNRLAGTDPVAYVAHETNASKEIGVATNTHTLYSLNTAGQQYVNLEGVVLDEGTGFALEIGTVQHAVYFTFVWDERPKLRTD